VRDVRFTEEMTGWYTPGCPAYDAGYHTGQLTGPRLSFHLTIGTDDLAAVRSDPRHRAAARGWVQCPSLGAGHLGVRAGTFDLFVPGSRPGRLAMRYRLEFDGAAQTPYVLVGFKDIAHDRRFDLWRDTTTLFVRVLRGVGTGADPAETGPDTGPEVGRGILRITPRMFARQMLTFRGRPGAVTGFAADFAATLAREYARPVRRAVAR
jgi:cholesterol oxidase